MFCWHINLYWFFPRNYFPNIYFWHFRNDSAVLCFSEMPRWDWSQLLHFTSKEHSINEHFNCVNIWRTLHSSIIFNFSNKILLLFYELHQEPNAPAASKLIVFEHSTIKELRKQWMKDGNRSRLRCRLTK